MHPIYRYEATLPYIEGKFLSQVYPAQFMQNLPFGKFSQNCCILCGVNMGHFDMFPHDKATPRATCQSCYNNWENIIFQKEQCIISGEWLSKEKLDAFHRDPHSLHNRLYDGRSEDYFCTHSVYAFGYSVPVLDTPLWQIQEQNNIIFKNVIDVDDCGYEVEDPSDDIIDADFDEIYDMQEALSSGMNSAPLGLPAPREQIHVPEIMPQTYKGKPVRVVPIKKDERFKQRVWHNGVEIKRG